MQGLGKSGQLGHECIDREGYCSIPHPVSGLRKVVHVSCGYTATSAVTLQGELFVWGRGVRMGHGGGKDPVPFPKRLEALVGVHVVSASLGEDHGGCVSSQGAVFLWGRNKSGCLGDGTTVDRVLPDRDRFVRVHSFICVNTVRVHFLFKLRLVSSRTLLLVLSSSFPTN